MQFVACLHDIGSCYLFVILQEVASLKEKLNKCEVQLESARSASEMNLITSGAENQKMYVSLSGYEYHTTLISLQFCLKRKLNKLDRSLHLNLYIYSTKADWGGLY